MLISNVDYLFGDFWSTKLGDKPKLYIEEINISLICVLFLYHFIKKIAKSRKSKREFVSALSDQEVLFIQTK